MTTHRHLKKQPESRWDDGEEQWAPSHMNSILRQKSARQVSKRMVRRPGDAALHAQSRAAVAATVLDPSAARTATARATRLPRQMASIPQVRTSRARAEHLLPAGQSQSEYRYY